MVSCSKFHLIEGGARRLKPMKRFNRNTTKELKKGEGLGLTQFTYPEIYHCHVACSRSHTNFVGAVPMQIAKGNWNKFSTRRWGKRILWADWTLPSLFWPCVCESSVRPNFGRCRNSAEIVSATFSLFRWLAETTCFGRNIPVSAKILLLSPSLLTSLFRSFTFVGKCHLNNKCCWRGGGCAKQYLSAETASMGRISLSAEFRPLYYCRISVSAETEKRLFRSNTICDVASFPFHRDELLPAVVYRFS